MDDNQPPDWTRLEAMRSADRLQLCADCSAHMPQLRIDALAQGLAFRFCSVYRTHATICEGRLTLQPCDSATVAQALERGMRTAL